jgi:DNA-binding transcriptional LysR family regulator
MPRTNVNDLIAFLAVARERSFTRAAAQMGVSQSALSHTIRGLEERLGLRLLTRTTRSVAPTEAGERLLRDIGHHFDEIDAAIDSLSELKERPSGTIRINSSEYAAGTILWPCLAEFLPHYPDLTVEIWADYALADIVAERFDAGVRLGEHVAKDMVAVRIGPDERFLIVGSPAYLAGRDVPRHPRDLLQHRCVNLRLPGGLYAWEFEKDGQPLKVRVEGQLVFNALPPILKAALASFGLAFLPQDMVRPHVAAGRLVTMLEDWTPPFPGYHLYYPSRRQQSPGFALLVEALRYRG